MGSRDHKTSSIIKSWYNKWVGHIFCMWIVDRMRKCESKIYSHWHFNFIVPRIYILNTFRTRLSISCTGDSYFLFIGSNFSKDLTMLTEKLCNRFVVIAPKSNTNKITVLYGCHYPGYYSHTVILRMKVVILQFKPTKQ